MGRLPSTPEQRNATTRRTMAPGGLGGRSDLPAPEPRPLPTPATVGAQVAAIWSMNPVAVTDRCPVYKVQQSGSLGIWEVTLDPASADDVEIDAIVNGSVVDSFTLAAGLDEDLWDLSAFDVVERDRVKIAITAAGSDDCALGVHAIDVV